MSLYECLTNIRILRIKKYFLLLSLILQTVKYGINSLTPSKEVVRVLFGDSNYCQDFLSCWGTKPTGGNPGRDADRLPRGSQG